ncbi:MAG: tetraacyldisaccharide 4'-kinase [Heliobacteriaceae bacterium]|jgi:tetraacyldisaccharide 4'-kinase|nr:tetraacyldisaccharide 4'-kinase [Heliobacteriaceae bacterium]
MKTKITKLHYDKNAKVPWFLEFCSFFYGMGSGFKNFLYDKGILKPTQVDAYVISVGNITTGGVGKTPAVAQIAKYFSGERVAVLSRGYGGGYDNRKVNVISPDDDVQMAGDEPLWLAQQTGVVVITCKNRIKAARFAVEKFGVTKIILDDGFQHRKLYRDLDIVLVDSQKRFGNYKLLPAGPLRESLAGLKRADKVVEIHKSGGDVYNIKTGAALPPGASVTAVCAIGQPQSFYDLLKDYNVIDTVTFDDHHQYELKDIEGISGNIITTEKDAVKLQKFGREDIYALKLKININVGELLNG